MIPLKPGKNYAPLKPLNELREANGKEPQKGKLAHYLTDAVHERYIHHMEEDKETWNDLIQVGHLTSLFIQGKQNLKWNKFTNSFYNIPIDHRNKAKMRVTPIMRFYETNCESRYVSSNPKIKVKAAREDDRARQSADGANTIVEYHEKELYTAWFNRSEALHKMSFGTQILQCRWSNEKEGFKAFKRIFEDREIPVSEGVGQCFDCGRNGTGIDFLQVSSSLPVCPFCQSNNAYAEPPSSAIIPVETQKIPVNLGGIVLKQLEFPACRWNLRVRAEESSHFIYETIISMGEVRNLFGDVVLPDDVRGSNNFGLEVVESLARAGMPLGGSTSTDDAPRSKWFKQRVKLTEYYLSAEDLSDIYVRGDEETLCGVKLPKDATYAQVFPEGATFIGLNGMRVLIGVYPGAVHKEELITGIWHQRQFSGAGQGVSDTVELNKRLNETDSQAFMAMKHNATPGVFYLDGAIETEYLDYLGHPDVAIPVTIGDSDAKSINDIIASPRLGATDAGMLQFYSQNLHNMIQLTMHVTTFSGGLPGVKNTTATGAQISEANAASLFGPILSIKMDNRVEAAKKFVKLYRDNVPVAQYFPLQSKYGAQQGVWLSGADLSKDLVYTVVENSQLPKTQYTIRDDIDRFFMTVGGGQGFMALRQTDPEFADEITDKYGVDFAINHFDEVAQINRERFESAKKLIRQFRAVEQQTNMLAAQLPSAESVGADPSVIDTSFDGETYNPVMPQENAEMTQPDPTAQMNAGANSLTATGEPSLMPQSSPQPLQQQMQMPDPTRQTAQMVLQMLKPKITLYEPNHELKADWFANFLDTDEGRRLDDLTREVVYAFIETHFTLGAQRAAVMAQLQGQVQVAGALPGQIADTAKQQYLAAQNNSNKANG